MKRILFAFLALPVALSAEILYPVASQTAAEAGTDTRPMVWSPLRVKQAIDQHAGVGSSDGKTIYGSGVPGGGTGNNNDVYIDVASGNFYRKAAGSWGSPFFQSQAYATALAQIAAGTWTGASTITTLGTIATGTWNATAIGATYGGTAQTSWASGDMLYASGTNTLAKLASTTANGRAFLTLSPSSNDMYYWNGSAWTAVASTTANGRAVLALSPSSGNMYYWNGSAWTAITTSSTGRGLLNASATTATGLGLTNGSVIDAWGAIATSAKVDAAGGTLTAGVLAGAIDVTGTFNYTSVDTVTSGTVVDVTKAFGSITKSADSTETFSTDNVAATRVITRVLTNSDGSAYKTFTFDTATDFTVSVPASSSVTVSMKSQGASGWALVNGPPSVVNLTAVTSPTSTRLVASTDATTGTEGKSTWAQVFANIGSGKLASAAGTATLANAGEVSFNTTDKQLGVHNGTKEVAIPTVHHIAVAFDPKAVCDGSVDRLFLMYVGSHAPKGITIVGWRLSFEADPTTEIDLDLKRADAYIGVANSAVMDVLATTSGASSEGTYTNINSGSVVANGKVIYLEFGTAYSETGHQCIFEMWYEIEED